MSQIDGLPPTSASHPDGEDWVSSCEEWARFHWRAHEFSSVWLKQATPPTSLNVRYADTVTNARIKRYMVKDVLIVTSEWDAAYCMIGYLVRRKHHPHLEIYDGDRMICLSVHGA